MTGLTFGLSVRCTLPPGSVPSLSSNTSVNYPVHGTVASMANTELKFP